MKTAFGGIEAGGTKFVCAVGTGPDDIRAEIRLPTESPDVTMGRVIDFFRAQQEQHDIAAIGVASFGSRGPGPRLPNLRVHYKHAKAGLGKHTSGADFKG